MAIWKKLKSRRDYKNALARVDELIDVKENDTRMNEFMLLTYLIEEYESEVFPMTDVTPLEVIRFMMEMKGIQQKDLIPILGSKSFVSKILQGTAKLQLEMIGPLSKFLGIPAETLIPPFDDRSNFITNSGNSPNKEIRGSKMAYDHTFRKSDRVSEKVTKYSKPIKKSKRRKPKE